MQNEKCKMQNFRFGTDPCGRRRISFCILHFEFCILGLTLRSMSPVTHFLIGWVAGAAADLDHRERVLVALGGVAPDADAFGVVPELLTRNSQHPLPWFTQYHHVLFHNLVFALVITGIA